MGVLMSAAEFVECLGVGVLLGDHESMKTKWIFSHFERIFSCERITERINKLSLGRSVCDGKDDIGKRPAELGFDRLLEIVRRALREEKRGQTLHFAITVSGGLITSRAVAIWAPRISQLRLGSAMGAGMSELMRWLPVLLGSAASMP